MSGREIVIHSLEHAEAALAAASTLNRPVTLASAPGAAAQAGPAWFKAVIEEAMAAHPDVAGVAILDCGDEPGAVMAALRLGLRRLRFRGPNEVAAKLAAMGAEFQPRAGEGEALDLHGARRPEEAARVFLERP